MGSNFFDTASASFDAHNISSQMVHTISIQPKRIKTSRLENRICLRVRIITVKTCRKKTRELAFCKHCEVLATAAQNVKTLMDIASQAIITPTFSKYRVDVVYLSEICLHGFWVITKSCSQQRHWIYYCGASDNTGEIAKDYHVRKNSFRFDWAKSV